MKSTLLTPEQETFPDRYRWTVESCYRLMEAGFLNGRFEVLDGEVVNKRGQNPPHYFGISQFVLWANSTFGDQCVRVQGPIALPAPDNKYSEPEPDVAITRDEAVAYSNHHPRPSEVRLIIEVSDTTLPTDLLVKARLYARAAIEEYWVLDLIGRQLHVHRQPADGEYRDIVVLVENNTVSPISRPDSPILIAGLFPPISE